jgi:predicted component of type VI protein secretion system
MNELQGKVYALIQKYETRLNAKRQQVSLNPNDCVEGVIIAMEDVIADLKEISK